MRAIEEIIAGRLTGELGQAAHHRHILTVFGLYARPAGVPIAVAAIVQLLQDLGAEPASVRSSISRLKKREVLISEHVKGEAGYALSPALEEHMRVGDERIFSPHPARVSDPWLLVSFSVPEAQRGQRHKIRSGLARMGFGVVGAGLCVAPGNVYDEALEYLQDNDLLQFVDFFHADHGGPKELRTKVAQWWDLDSLEAHYQEFIDKYSVLLGRWGDPAQQTEAGSRAAFGDFIRMVTDWRALPYLDPGLPAEALPESWKGGEARSLFLDLRARLSPLAGWHAQRVIHSAGAPAGQGRTRQAAGAAPATA
ncbi:transcriptional regulator [Paeniglutamicibacter sp. ABSL32-1]|uniref:PaaX family transcriptional regulator n=1 Tax=Paeniglutamicibacter quisquiliarum TaxID=2849498 RepID=UPI001C2D058F|nr:PaaX family transcriptional regulator C-terminal domain-containing protein [Paeniglutamicibacter quisquiliarum]MBV1781288.1 transcriptional regulator [Paeniglutamicibacter quisquiliarum]